MRKVFDMLRLDGRVALITGARQGLGYDIACALAEAGATIVMTSRNEESIRGVAQEIAKEFELLKDVPVGYSFLDKMITAVMGKEFKLNKFINIKSLSVNQLFNKTIDCFCWS